MTGLIYDDESYNKIRCISPAQSFSGTDEPAMSLRQYCPIPGDQGDIASCVGWAIAYGAYTTVVSKMNNITDKRLITDQAYSALFLYNQIKSADCKIGANMGVAFDFLQKTGVCRMNEFAPKDCNTMPDRKIIGLAKNSRIKSYLKLFPIGTTPENKISATIQEIQRGRPVVVGMNITKSFEKIGNDGLWSPQAQESLAGAGQTHQISPQT